MKVIIVGLPLFAKRLAADLNEFDSTNHYVAYDTYYSKWDQMKFLMALPFAKVVISMNGVSEKSGSLSWVLRLKKKLVFQWMGTDALIAMENFKKGTIYRDYMDYALNCVDSPWLMEEVSSIGLIPCMKHVKYLRKELVPCSQYREMRVLTYIAQDRQEFYGLDWVIRLAKANPTISFDVFGMSHSVKSIPVNIHLLGWQAEDEVLSAIKQAPIFLRLTDHDGFSVSVIEALSLGAEVLMRLPSPWTHLVDESNVEEVFNAVCKKVIVNDFKPNFKTRELAMIEFNKYEVLSGYVKMLKAL